MASDLRVCFLGDSFVAGVGDPEYRGWVGRLAARSHLTGTPLTSYNLGVRRQTSRDLLERGLSECRPRLPGDCDGRVVLSFGVNDGALENGAPRVGPEASTANLTILMDEIRDAGWEGLVVGPPPVGDEAQNRRVALLDRSYRHVCQRANVLYVSVHTQLGCNQIWMREVRDGDGSHPAASGYAELAGLIWPHWATWVSP